MLEVDGIDLFYGDMQALWGVSLRVDRGEIVTLVGANGAGKTSTLRTISGLSRPASGRILLDGVPIQGMAAHRVVELGIVQIPEGRKLWPTMTVTENLELGAYPRAARLRKSETLQQVMELFPPLAERRRQLAGTLSGGEQQMLAIGRGLMSRPRLLMLDEPSLGLAPIVVTELFRIIRQIQTQGVTVLLVEQNVLGALKLADRAYVLETGRVVLQGTAAELLGNEHVKAAYLGL
jgi:branched-chain amino acid transport system ATP-binding protein